jgi:hypothetical protein
MKKVTLFFDKDSHIINGNNRVFENVTELTPHNAYGFLEIVFDGVRQEFNLAHVLWFQVEGEGS